MNKLLIGLIIASISPLVIAEQSNWIETQAGSHIFISKKDISTDKQNPDIKTTKISVNIPAMQDRRANPTRTTLTNPYPISYVTEFIINCKDKTAKIGNQQVHENFFGEGKLLEEAKADPVADFAPMQGADAIKIWEVTCTVPQESK